jgi:hypothetical protein
VTRILPIRDINTTEPNRTFAGFFKQTKSSGARFLRSWEAGANSNVGSQLIVTVKVLVHHAARSLFGMFANLPGSIYPKQTNFTTNLSSDELEQEPQSIGLLIWWSLQERRIDYSCGNFSWRELDATVIGSQISRFLIESSWVHELWADRRQLVRRSEFEARRGRPYEVARHSPSVLCGRNYSLSRVNKQPVPE